MSAEKGLALPLGTKVRVISSCVFPAGQIVTKNMNLYSLDSGQAFDFQFATDYLNDDQWEPIEEPKQEWLIQDANGNLTKSDSFRMPKQGDIIQVRDCSDEGWIDDTFVAFFDGKAITTPGGDEFNIWNEWRFPEGFEEVTLKNGLTYEVQWNDDDELVLKLKELR